MVQQTNPWGNLLKDISTTEEEFLTDMRTFCKLPIRFFFQLKKQFNAKISRELIFYPVRTDAFNKKPHRAFLFTHPEMGELMCYIVHVTVDWFNVAISLPVFDEKNELVLKGDTLFSMTIWSLDGLNNEKVNSSYFSFHYCSEGSIKEGEENEYFQNLEKLYRFQLDVIKTLKSCK